MNEAKMTNDNFKEDKNYRSVICCAECQHLNFWNNMCLLGGFEVKFKRKHTCDEAAVEGRK